MAVFFIVFILRRHPYTAGQNVVDVRRQNVSILLYNSFIKSVGDL